MLLVAVGIVAFGAWLGVLAGVLLGAYAAFRASLNLAEQRPSRWQVRLNRFQAVWYADQLSERGLSFRRLHLIAMKLLFGGMGVFLICCLIIGILNGQIQWGLSP
jgi:hypothetical protein